MAVISWLIYFHHVHPRLKLAQSFPRRLTFFLATATLAAAEPWFQHHRLQFWFQHGWNMWIIKFMLTSQLTRTDWQNRRWTDIRRKAANKDQGEWTITNDLKSLATSWSPTTSSCFFWLACGSAIPSFYIHLNLQRQSVFPTVDLSTRWATKQTKELGPNQQQTGVQTVTKQQKTYMGPLKHDNDRVFMSIWVTISPICSSKDSVWGLPDSPDAPTAAPPKRLRGSAPAPAPPAGQVTTWDEKRQGSTSLTCSPRIFG